VQVRVLDRVPFFARRHLHLHTPVGIAAAAKDTGGAV